MGISFIDQREFIALQTLSGCRAPHCDKHKFHTKMINYFLDVMVQHSGSTRKTEIVPKIALHLLQGFRATIWGLLIIKALKVTGTSS